MIPEHIHTYMYPTVLLEIIAMGRGGGGGGGSQKAINCSMKRPGVPYSH